MAASFPLERWTVTRCTDSGLSQISEDRGQATEKPFHPGEMLLEEFLKPQGMSQAAFARQIGWNKARLNELIRGKRGVTAEAAPDLADTLGTSPKLWMNVQATYDLDRAAAARKVA
ncbi:MAG: HigA family addiction module antitoxin [Congregibacter sp.]